MDPSLRAGIIELPASPVVNDYATESPCDYDYCTPYDRLDCQQCELPTPCGCFDCYEHSELCTSSLTNLEDAEAQIYHSQPRVYGGPSLNPVLRPEPCQIQFFDALVPREQISDIEERERAERDLRLRSALKKKTKSFLSSVLSKTKKSSSNKAELADGNTKDDAKLSHALRAYNVEKGGSLPQSPQPDLKAPQTSPWSYTSSKKEAKAV
jgi:hypothetical protein